MNRSLLRNEPQYPTAHPGPTPHAPLEPLTSNPLDYVLSHSHPAPPERTGSGSAHAAKPLAVLALSLLRLARPRTASVVRSPLRPAPVVLVALVRGASSSSSSSPPLPPPALLLPLEPPPRSPAAAPLAPPSGARARPRSTSLVRVRVRVRVRTRVRVRVRVRVSPNPNPNLGGDVAVHEHGQPREAHV